MTVVDPVARAARVVVPGLPALAGHRQGGPERPAGRPAHRLADRHPQRAPGRPSRRTDATGRRADEQSTGRSPCRSMPGSRPQRVTHPIAKAVDSDVGPFIDSGCQDRASVNVAAQRTDAASAPTGEGPVRTCIGCRTRERITALFRVVAVDGYVVPDPRRRLPGRGAWLHPDDGMPARRGAASSVRQGPAGPRATRHQQGPRAPSSGGVRRVRDSLRNPRQILEPPVGQESRSTQREHVVKQQ